jgi:glycosyltransferase involved in cell wall biosynthesis
VAREDIDISVVICAFSERRWRELGAAIESLQRQTSPAREIIVVIDHNEGLLARARSAWPEASVLPNRNSRGLSGAKNSGASVARGEVVAFLDDDAEADERWLERLASAYQDSRILAAGGAVEPLWPSDRPAWFPPEFDWVVGCSYSGMPRETSVVRNLFGGNMSIRRQPLADLGGFVDGIGRSGTKPVGCEETELCIRARQRWPDRLTLYVPDARIRHTVTRERTSPTYFVSRCLAEGRSKAIIGGLVGHAPALETERAYVRRTLSAGFMAGLWGALRRQNSIGRPLAILVGLAVTSVGYVWERLGGERLAEFRSTA